MWAKGFPMLPRAPSTRFLTLSVQPVQQPFVPQHLDSDGGRYCNLLGVECPRPDVESIFFLGYDMSGEAYMYEGDLYPAKPEAFAFGRRWYRTAEELWASGKWQPHRQSVGIGGLLGLLDGLQTMRQGLVSGEKLVYRVEDTQWPSPP